MSESQKHTDYSDKRIILATKHLLLDWPPRNTIQEDKSSVQILCIGENEKDKELFLSKIRRSKDQIESDDKKHITIQTIRFRCNDELYAQTNLILWNVASSARMRVGTINYYQHALGVCLLYNIYDRESFEKIKEIWIHDMHRQGWEGACLLVGIDHDEENDAVTESDATSNTKNINQISSSEGIVGDEETAEDSKDNVVTMGKQRKSTQISQQEGMALANKYGMLFMELTLHKSSLSTKKLLNSPPNQSETTSISNPSTSLTLQEDIPTSNLSQIYTPQDALSTLLYYAIERHSHSPSSLTSTNSSTLHYRYHQHPPIAPAYLTYFHTCIASSALYCPIYPAVDHLIVETPSPTRGEVQYDFAFKIALIGDTSCGKTAFLRRLCQKNLPFTEEIEPTIGVDFNIRRGKIRWPSTTVSPPTSTSTSPDHEMVMNQTPQVYHVKLLIWELSGLQRHDQVVSSYYRGSRGFFLTYDVNNRVSFYQVRSHWVQLIRERSLPMHKLSLVLVGLKVPVHEDYAEFEETLSLQSRREVSYQEGWKLAMEYQIPFIECSAETGKGIEDAYTTMIHSLIEKHSEERIGRGTPPYRRRMDNERLRPGNHIDFCCIT